MAAWLIPFCGRVTVRSSGLPHFISSFITRWALRLFPLLWMLLLWASMHTLVRGYVFLFLLGVRLGVTFRVTCDTAVSGILQDRVLFGVCGCCQFACTGISLFTPPSPHLPHPILPPGCRSERCHFPAVWPWASHLHVFRSPLLTPTVRRKMRWNYLPKALTSASSSQPVDCILASRMCESVPWDPVDRSITYRWTWWVRLWTVVWRGFLCLSPRQDVGHDIFTSTRVCQRNL